MADETKVYRVSLLNGSEAQDITVPLRAPFNKKVRRHFETIRELGDGRKKLEYELKEVEVAIDVEAEMRADAIRGWNAGRGSAIAAKNLKIDPVAEVAPVSTEVPRLEGRRARGLQEVKTDPAAAS